MSEDDRKMFVGGISWDTTEEGLSEYFSTYGQLESVKLITDRETGRSKGFAFVVFYEQNDLETVLTQGTHEIDGRSVTPRRATPGGGGREVVAEEEEAVDMEEAVVAEEDVVAVDTEVVVAAVATDRAVEDTEVVAAVATDRAVEDTEVVAAVDGRCGYSYVFY